MMTNVCRATFTLVVVLLSQWCLGEAQASVRRLGPAGLSSQADAIVVAKVGRYSADEQRAQGEVLANIRGDLEEGASVLFIYPDPLSEETWTEWGPLEEGTCLLAFLKKPERGDLWLPASAERIRVGSFRIRAATGEEGRYASRRSFVKVLCQEAAEISRLFAQLIKWDEMSREDRYRSLQECFVGQSSSMKRIATEWLTLNRRLDFGDPEAVVERLAGWFVGCATDPDRQIKERAMVGLGLVARKREDVVPYLVDALDDPDVRHLAVTGLKGGVGRAHEAPVIDASAGIEVQVQAWKDWWREKGSQIPEFERFVPAGRAESPPPPEFPQNESERRK
jgi:hypothetical protein